MERVLVEAEGVPRSKYPVIIGRGILGTLSTLIDLKPYSTVCVVADSDVATHLAALREGLPKAKEVVLDLSEDGKNITSTQWLWGEFQKHGLDRESLVINVGGGVTGDLGGFAASTYMRGIDFVQIPTTLLSQVDASVGGKVGVNVGRIKNLVGTFTQPKAVVIDVSTLATLPMRELNSGYAEILKHGLILDREYFDLVASAQEAKDSMSVIKRSVELKAQIVNEDERESGRRKLLNFGHTLGHALEALALDTPKPLLHGEAIALGIVGESWIASELKKISLADLKTIEEALMRYSLPIRLSETLDRKAVLKKISTDKKSSRGVVRWTLLNKIGEGIVDQTVSDELVRSALDYLQEA